MKKNGFCRIMLMMMVVAMLGGVLAAPAQGGLWLRMTFNDDDGTDDGGSSSYYGTGTGISYVDSPGGRAASLTDPDTDSYFNIEDGSTDYLPSRLASSGMSVAYWVKANVSSQSYMSLLTTGTNSPTTEDSIQHSLTYPSGGSPPYTTWRFYDYSWWISPPYAADTWYHLVYTYEKEQGTNYLVKLYVDGSYVTSNSRGRLATDDQSALLGMVYNSGLNEPYDGEIDQFEIYDSTLTSTDVSDLYDEGPVGGSDPNDPPSDLWLRMTFNDEDGANDIGSSSYYGTAYNISYVSSPGGKAANLTDPCDDSYFDIKDGITDYLPSTLADSGLSVAYWLKANTSTQSYMALLTTGTDSPTTPDSIQNALAYPSGGSPPYTSWRFYDYSWWISPPYVADTWYHLVYTYEPAGGGNFTTTVYVDGSSLSTQSRGALATDDQSALLGMVYNSGYYEPFDGLIDQFEIHTTALDSTEVSDLYNAGPIDTAERVETPTFSPAAGTYIGTESITITTATSGATIYYTTDGSTPDSSDTEYTSAITGNSIFTLKAIAIKNGLDDSLVKIGAYTIYFQSANYLSNRSKTFINDNRIVWLDAIQYDDDQLFYNTKIDTYIADATTETFTLTAGGDQKPSIRALNIVSDGTVVNPWILTDSDDCIDSYSVETVAADLDTGGMSDQEKAIAVFEYFADIQYWDTAPIEYIEGQSGYGVVPGAIVNSAGYATCPHQGPLMVPYLLEIGLSDARKRRFGPDSATIFHSTTEAYFDSAWHVLDLTENTYYLKSDDSTLASVAELIADTSMVERNAGDDRLYDPTWVSSIGMGVKYGWEFDGGTTGMPGTMAAGWLYPPQRLPDITLGPTQKFSRMNANEGSYWQAWNFTDPYTVATENTRREATMPEYFGNGYLEYELDPCTASFTTLVPSELTIFSEEFLHDDLEYRSWWDIQTGTPYANTSATGDVSPYYAMHLSDDDKIRTKQLDFSGQSEELEVIYSWQRNSTENGDDLEVYYTTGGSYTNLLTHLYNDGSADTWNEYSQMLPSGCNSSRFRLQYKATCGDDSDHWWIDDITIIDHNGGRVGLTIDTGSPPCRPTSQGTPGYFILPIDSSHTIIDLIVDGDFCRPSASDTVTVSYSVDGGGNYTSLLTVTGTGSSVLASAETPILRGMYNVLVKFTFNSSTGSPCGLNTVSVKARIQNNPRVIPPLEIGSNSVYYSSDSQTADVNISYIYVEREEIPISIDWENLKPGCIDAVFFCDTSSAVTTDITVTMTNKDTGSLTITPSVSHVPSGWTVVLDDTSPAVLAASASKELTLSVTPPASNPEGAVGAELNFYTSTYGNAHKRLILTAVDGFISLQAEDAGTLTDTSIDSTIEGDSGTSIIVDAGYEGTGYARFTGVTVPHTDSYYLMARIRAENTNYQDMDMLKCIVDGNTRIINRYDETTVSHRKQDHFVERWTWWRNTSAISLSSGTITIDVYGLKDDILIDSLVLVTADELADKVLMNQLYCPVGFDEAIAD